VKPGDVVVDATCGNGHDTIKLAQVGFGPKRGSCRGAEGACGHQSCRR
jgi:hypothetical protein